MSGAGAVLALVLIEWTAGWIAAAAWSQSWGVVRRGHFRITSWVTAALGVMAYLVDRSAAAGHDTQISLVLLLAVLSVAYSAAQYVRSDAVGTVVGAGAGVAGAGALVASASLLEGWNAALVAPSLVAGALLLGAVTNGMMLGHWYLNQPGLKTFALARLTDLSLAAVALSLATGAAGAAELAAASTEGAVLGLPGFGESFGTVFFVVWVVTLGFTGAVAWAARRCVKIRSIQSATGLFYVALLAAGVAEFLVRYLTVNAS